MAEQSELRDQLAERPQAGEFVVGGVLVAGAAFALLEVTRITSPVGYSPAGPRFIPLVVCLIWLGLALAYLGQALRHRLRGRAVVPAPQDAPVSPAVSPPAAGVTSHRADRPAGDPAAPAVPTPGAGGLRTLATPALLVAVLIGYVLVLDLLGYILATALAFVACAWVIGSRKLIRDVVIGVLLAVGIYYAFTELLAIRLPAGVLPL
jgi:putative tricarboxylic transport membrane protein